MKIKDFVNMDAEKKTKLKALTTFQQAPNSNFSERENYQPPPQWDLSPFEQAIIEEIFPEVERILEGEIPRPVITKVYLSCTCKHNCSGCLYGNDQRKEKVFMDPNNFGRLFDHLYSLKIKFIDLSGGESTLHPEFCRFARMGIKEKFKLSLLSNGVWLDQESIDLLIEGFSFLRVNLDAASDEVYNRIHRPPAPREFQKVLRNLEKIANLREKRKSELIVGAKVKLCQANMNFMEEIVNLVKDSGMDYIQFWIDHKVFDPPLPEQTEGVSTLIRELKNRYHPFSVYGEIESKKFDDGCWFSFLHLIIDPKGYVYHCSHFPHNLVVTSFGNIFTISPEKLWFGSEHKEIVDRLSVNNCPIEDCRWCFYNKLIWRMIKKDQKGIHPSIGFLR